MWNLVLLNPDMPCLCKQCRFRSVGFWRSQLIWICTVCYSVCEFILRIWIKWSDWLKKIRSGQLTSLFIQHDKGLIWISCLDCFSSKGVFSSGPILSQGVSILMPGSILQSVTPLTADPGVASSNPSTALVQIDPDIISSVILPLQLIQEGQLSVTGERMCSSTC